MVAKSEKLDCRARITRISSSCVGCMSWETMYMMFQTPYGQYKWQSDAVEQKSRTYSEGDTVHLKAFIRKGTRNLFRVNIRHI